MRAIFGDAKYCRTCGSLFRQRHADGERRQHRLVQRRARTSPRPRSCSRRPATTAARWSCCRRPTSPIMNNPRQLLVPSGCARPASTSSWQRCDWAGVVQRRAVKKPPAEGGWNIFLTCVSAARHSAIRSASSAHAANGDKAWFGWPTNDQAGEAARRLGARRDARGAQGGRPQAAGERLGLRPACATRPVVPPVARCATTSAASSACPRSCRSGTSRSCVRPCVRPAAETRALPRLASRHDRHTPKGTAAAHAAPTSSAACSRRAGHGDRRRVRLPAAASVARRSGRDHRRRQRDAPRSIARSAHKLGLDEPLPVQFVRWVGGGAAGRPRHLDLLERAGDDS